MSESTSLLGDMLARITETGRSLIGSEVQAPLADRAEALLASDGEVTGTARAKALLDDYAAMAREERLDFLRDAATRFGPDVDAVRVACEAFLADPGPSSARALHDRAEPRSQELLRLLNRAPGGTLALVRMREDLLGALRAEPELEREVRLLADVPGILAEVAERGIRVAIASRTSRGQWARK
ncbi:MAG: malonyl-CoA decarboxylase N-terminal domain-containing protein, partial [Pseudomonadota bacterium]